MPSPALFVRNLLRIFTRRPSVSLAIALTLALGIGANATIFSFVNALLLRPLPFPDAERLVRIESIRGGEAGKLMSREWEEFNRADSIFEGVAAWYPSQYNLAEGGPPEAVVACMTTGNLFRVLGVRVVEGASWPEDYWQSRHAVVVLNHGLWQRRYGGDPGIVGKTITMDYTPYRVAGVAAPGLEFPINSQIFRAANFRNEQNKGLRNLFAVARLRKGLSLSQAQSRVDVLTARLQHLYPDTNTAIGFRLTTLRNSYVGDVRPYLLVTLALAVAVLAIACSNVVNLLLADGMARAQEFAIRTALGADRNAMLRQLLAESLLLTLPGCVTGLALAYWWVRLLRDLLAVDLPRTMSIEVDHTVVLFTVGISLLTGVLAGLPPAFAASRPQLESVLRDASRGSSEGVAQARARWFLVAGELALAFTLLTTAALLVQSFWRVQAVTTGFRSDRLLTFRVDPPFGRYNLPEHTVPFYRRTEEALLALPGVESVAANHSLPLAVNENYGKPSVVVEGQSVTDQLRNPYVNPQIVSPGYLRTMAIPVVAGRGFTEEDRLGTPPLVVIGEPLARRLFRDQNPVGHRVRFIGLLAGTEKREDAWFTIIGVAGAVKSASLFAEPGMDVYFSNRQQFAGDSFFVARSGMELSAFARSAAAVVRGIDADQAIFDVKAMRNRMDESVWQRRIAGRLSMGFGVLALLLAAIGAYSVIAFGVSRRTREMGIRLALGATPSQVRRLVVTEGMRTACCGIAIGLVLAAAAAKALTKLLYDIGAFDPITFAATTAITLAVSVAACYLPARRASAADPGAALRNS
jgi:putative ABC transport system permease protein